MRISGRALSGILDCNPPYVPETNPDTGASECVEPILTPSYTTSPGLPIGTATVTGAIPTNPTGITLVTTPGGGTSDILAQTEAANQAAEQACQGMFQTWDPDTVNCGTNWTTIILTGALVLAGIAVLGMAVKR